jgi:hypothetical protein
MLRTLFQMDLSGSLEAWKGFGSRTVLCRGDLERC